MSIEVIGSICCDHDELERSTTRGSYQLICIYMKTLGSKRSTIDYTNYVVYIVYGSTKEFSVDNFSSSQ